MGWLIATRVERFTRRVEPTLQRLCGPRGRLRILSPAFKALVRMRRRLHWERLWSIERQRPVEHLSTAVPSELVEAVETGWIPPASSIMDIGAGRGQISAWLAEHGFRVLGVDLSSGATKLANEHFHHLSERLEFRTLDICSGPPEPARFDVLIDRGCFHGVPPPLRERYAANVAAWAKPDARFLLLSRIDKSEDQLVELIAAVLGRYFEIVRTQPTALSRSAGPYPRTVRPGLVFWMIRREGDPRI